MIYGWDEKKVILLHCDAIKCIKSVEGTPELSLRSLSRNSSQVSLVDVPWAGYIRTTSWDLMATEPLWWPLSLLDIPMSAGLAGVVSQIAG